MNTCFMHSLRRLSLISSMTIFEFTLFGIHIAPTWYGLSYGIGLLLGYFFLRKRLKLSENQAESLFLWIFLGIILGGRIGYILFYDISYFLSHPEQILQIWKGGMSFHGGLVGAISGIYIASKRIKIPFLQIADQAAIITPIGLFFGRISNYLNNELYGFSPYNGPFPMMVHDVAHFPSPLLEAALEGIILGIILFVVDKKIHGSSSNQGKLVGIIGGLFLLIYGIFRIFIEFFRLPDIQIGYIFHFITLGQLLSIPLIIVGGWLYLRGYKK